MTQRLPGVAGRLRRPVLVESPEPSRARAVRQHGPWYAAEIRDAGTRRVWRCPHKHLTPASASRCVGVMEKRIGRLGWELATRQRRVGKRRPPR